MIGKHFFSNQSGNASIMFAVSLPVLLAISGGVTMYSKALQTQTHLQAALDAGALAGTILGPEASTAQRIRAAKAAFAANFTGNASMGAISSGVAGNSVVRPSFVAAKWEVSGEASANFDNPFSFFIGKDQITVTSKSAAVKIISAPICILGLNPTQKETIDMTGQPVINAKDCAAQANSQHGSGINQQGKPELNAKMIGVTGGYTGSGYSSPPIRRTIPVPDPYKNVPFPDVGRCTYTNLGFSQGTHTIKPGVYCGGLRITAQAQVTMEPGIYIMKDGPLWINGDAQLYGREVLVAFTGDATLYMEGSSKLDLTSQVSGAYMNIQFLQDRDVKERRLYFTIIGNSQFSIDGVLYAPNLNVWFAGGSVINISTPSYAVVADKIWLQDQTVLNVDYVNKRNLPIAGASGFKYGARLFR